MLNPRLGRSFIGVWNETWEWKVERGAKRNIVEHLCTGFIISSTTENGDPIETDNIAMLCYFYATLLSILIPGAVLLDAFHSDW